MLHRSCPGCVYCVVLLLYDILLYVFVWVDIMCVGSYRKTLDYLLLL